MPPRERRTLVTGAAGFIGSTLSEALVAEGWRVTGLDGFIGAHPRAAKEANLEPSRASRASTSSPRTSAADDLPPSGRGAAGRPPRRPAGVRSSFGDGFGTYLRDNVHATHRLIGAPSGRRAALV